jgi:hypothetical protein
MFERLDQARSLTANQIKILFLCVKLAGIAGRVTFAFLSEAIGRRAARKIIGPLSLAPIAGTSDVLTPKATPDAIVPSFM